MTVTGWCLIALAVYVLVFLAYCAGCTVGYRNAVREHDEMYVDLDRVAMPDYVQ